MALSANKVAISALPIVDVSGLFSDDPEAWLDVAFRIRAACLDKGFMYVTGHGIPARLRASVLAESARFFEKPEPEKLRVSMNNSAAKRGYEAMRAQTLEAGAPPDLKEGFYIGRHKSADHPDVVAGLFKQGPNQWPDDMPKFQAVMEDYYDRMESLGTMLFRGLSLSLDLGPDYFEGFCTDPSCGLRLLHYPPQQADADPDEKGCGAHTDFGGLTMLMQDDVGGLQVWDEGSGWLHAPPIPDSFIVNLGDMVSRWTNDVYRSTLHRVVNTTGKERYSVPYFYSGNPAYEVSCIPTCLKHGETPNYVPTTVEGHLKEMYARTYAQ